MNTKNTLKAIVARTPRRDREDKALRPFPMGLGEARHSCRPKTLPDLREKLGPKWGVLAVENVKLTAILRWAKKQPDYRLPEPAEAISVSVALFRQELDYHSGLEGHGDTPRPNPMETLSPECQTEARRVAIRAYGAWERAGKPELYPSDIVRTHRYYSCCLKRSGALEITA